MRNIQVERLRKLPRRAAVAWQGGWVRLPMWLDNDAGPSVRLWAALWACEDEDYVGPLQPVLPDEINDAGALTALTAMACGKDGLGYRPGLLKVNDSGLAEYLAGVLADAKIDVVAADHLPAVDRCIASLTEHVQGAAPLPGPLTGAGVTVERMRRFAEAGKAFYEARPWELLTGEDPIEVVAPAAPEGLSFFVVLGVGGQTHGLGFFDSYDDYWRIQDERDESKDPRLLPSNGAWSVQFYALPDAPFADADLWDDHNLPAAGPHAHPLAMHFKAGGDVERPGAATLAFLEGLLRVMAESTEDQIDAGRWTRRADTADGSMDFTLALPDLLAPPSSRDQFARGVIPDRRAMERITAQIGGLFAETPAGSAEQEKAQELCYQAFDARGRRRILLARQALDICPDCADAYVILAEHAADPDKAFDLYARGVAAGERTLGEKRFKEDAGHFWGLTDTRPYMRARANLAHMLAAAGRIEEAAGHYQALLKLNPTDNQGLRFSLVPLLIRLNEDEAAERLLDQFEDDVTTAPLYARALLAFRAHGDTPATRNVLRAARQANRHVPRFLLDEETIFTPPPTRFTFGSEEEAHICAHDAFDAWEDTPMALDWLEIVERDAARRKRKRMKAKRLKNRKK